MNDPSIRIEGAILSPDILDALNQTAPPPPNPATGLSGIMELRRLHVQLDTAIRAAKQAASAPSAKPKQKPIKMNCFNGLVMLFIAFT